MSDFYKIADTSAATGKKLGLGSRRSRGRAEYRRDRPL
jgi:hypothetical protein